MIKDGFTKGKIGYLERLDTIRNGKKKWYVTFDGGWCGWYDKEDLEVID